VTAEQESSESETPDRAEAVANAPPSDLPRSFPCPGCGARLEYRPGSMHLECPYCAFREDLPAAADQVDEHDYERWLAAEHPTATLTKTREIRCEACGASTATDQLAASCPFCGASRVVPLSREEAIAVEAVLPFRIEAREAAARLDAWLKSRWFAPSSLRRHAAKEGLHGVYVPHFTFDAFTASFYSGARGDHYYVTVPTTRLVNGKPMPAGSRQRRTRWSGAAGHVERAFDDVLVVAQTSIPPKDLVALEPWDLKSLEPYQPSYLAGFDAGLPDVDLEGAFAIAKGKMTDVIRGDVRRDIGGDEQRIDSLQTSWSALTFKHVLLPVWITAYRFRGKVYRVLVNARTGEVSGARPYSRWKIALLVLAVAAAITVVIVLSR
jgi:DNA-directed RNA polymerase subunit RPC12/RpoP